MKQSPVIVIGMHRSGTSMLTRFISDLGIFMGNDKSVNDESKYFQNLNKWILYQIGASWDHPSSVDLIDDRFIGECTKVVRRHFKSAFRREYYGWKRSLRNRNISETSFRWGWKDPRTTILLPVYKEIFPDAKIVHISRHPVDVASSLRTRELKQWKKTEYSTREAIKIKFLKYERLINHSLIAGDLNNGVKLWEFYTERALKAGNLFDEVMHIRYEDFLLDPEPVLNDLTNFLEIDPNQKLINEVIAKVKPERRYAFQNDSNLKDFFETIKDRPLIHQLKYHELSQ